VTVIEQAAKGAEVDALHGPSMMPGQAQGVTPDNWRNHRKRVEPAGVQQPVQSGLYSAEFGRSTMGAEMKIRSTASLVALVQLLGFAAPVFGNELDDALAANQRGDYLTALRLCRQPAEDGNEWCQRTLGWAYRHGKGVPQDYVESVKWYRKAAEQGHASAQYSVGVAYAEGTGVPQDYAEAVKWFRKAAEQGKPDAQYGVGVAYANGKGVPQDYAEAVKWFRKAAEQGKPDAQVNLGVSYGKGQGVPQDNVQAHLWFNLAAANYPASDSENREIAVKNRDAMAAIMTPEQIAEAQKLAHEWKTKKEGGGD
jgi:TPR repeat protein